MDPRSITCWEWVGDRDPIPSEGLDMEMGNIRGVLNPGKALPYTLKNYLMFNDLLIILKSRV